MILIEESLDELTGLIQYGSSSGSINATYTTNHDNTGNWEVRVHIGSKDITIESTQYSLGEALSKIALALEWRKNKKDPTP